MTTLSIEFKNADIVRQGLLNLADQIPKTMQQHTRVVAQAVRYRMEIYPPEPPFSTYIRTFTLGNTWRMTPITNGYRVYNETPYAVHVVGNTYGLEQAWMHVGNWQVLRDVAEEEADKSATELINDIATLAKQQGF